MAVCLLIIKFLDLLNDKICKINLNIDSTNQTGFVLIFSASIYKKINKWQAVQVFQ